MSSEASSVYNEKTIAAYEASFRESSFSKPQDVYLTVSAAHVYGQAYVMEQQGTSESDPVYQRFVCSLDEITKVYINDNVKASPLFIQCDRDVKGVVHRKRIIVPCLPNVSDIVDQINEVKAAFVIRFNEKQERQKEEKRRALEEERQREMQLAEEAAWKRLTDGPTLSKLAGADDILSVTENPDTEKHPKESVKEKLSHMANKEIFGRKSAKSEISVTLSDQFEAEERAKVGKFAAEKAAAEEKAKAEKLAAEKEAAEEKAKAEKIAAEKAAAEEKARAEKLAAEKAAAEEKAKAEKLAAEKAAAEEKAKAEKLAAEKAAAEEKARAKKLAAKKAAEEKEKSNQTIAEAEEMAKKLSAKKPPVKRSAPVARDGETVSLADFESAVKQLKSQLDSGEITAAEFSAEKKKLLAKL
ncbi:MAG: SHOCT domain-containing protein [Oscillospiraceae bacterium]|nr:SHOCT domain-containing protein [Oscillospiraceae bacterium]